jgi:hypothetical protein
MPAAASIRQAGPASSASPQRRQRQVGAGPLGLYVSSQMLKKQFRVDPLWWLLVVEWVSCPTQLSHSKLPWTGPCLCT